MDKIWYYMKADRTKYGPYTDHELANLISKGIVTEDDYIWMPDLANWIRLGDSIYSYYIRESSKFDNDFNI
ncbi:MAG: DUF4339 domain-containing protein [Solobacterium sp.]|nr:DUF4339 domain-containing protein [Solobacterium sp.]MCH4048861.1 DUF4339 domain-containing protein [Solobacterium sp.]MCH4074385.1 DUF4339 domain-containing protein [Solobacterium sp.]MCI1313932.1 DUF4339 domain-containing protein [Solobacterium sp.]MCI1346069.1 DUF4339 domain-containing protein [Solobacterium sp.]